MKTLMRYQFAFFLWLWATMISFIFFFRLFGPVQHRTVSATWVLIYTTRRDWPMTIAATFNVSALIAGLIIMGWQLREIYRMYRKQRE